MTKKKPDGKTLINYRIELQDKERDLLEQMIVGQQVTTVIDSVVKAIASMDIMTMYGVLTLLEGFGIVDTPILTLSDLMQNPEDSSKAAAAAAISEWSKNRKETRETLREEREAAGEDRGFRERTDEALYSAYDKFWVTRFIGMILDPEGTNREA